ncbi:NAD-dependent deacetylase [Microbacteriaceae bacterium 4G12]
MNDLHVLAQWMEEAQHTVVLTGAGMSTESGVPDFRSQQGLWTKYDPFTVSHIRTLESDYDAFHEFYSFRMKEMEKVKPNDGHHILARWQQRGKIKFLATQNIESLHQQAGSTDVAQLHGGLETIHCQSCNASASKQAFFEKQSCVVCGGKLRPDIVLFGETLPEAVWTRTFEEVERADLLMVIGTSLQVSPVNQLPQMSTGKVVIINLEPTPFDSDFDLAIHRKVGEVLREVEYALQKK